MLKTEYALFKVRRKALKSALDNRNNLKVAFSNESRTAYLLHKAKTQHESNRELMDRMKSTREAYVQLKEDKK